MNDLYAICPDVTRYIADNYSDADLVLELGGGSGSPLLHQLLPQTITVEDDPVYVTMLVERGCNYIHAALRDGWYSLTDVFVDALSRADVVIIDGPRGKYRPNCAAHLHLIKPGAIVVFDDTNREKNRQVVAECIIEGWTLLHHMKDLYNRKTHILQKPAE